MKHIAAYLLLVLGGNATPSAADVTGLLEKVGVEADADKVALLIKNLEGKTLDELIVAGEEKMISVGGAGGAGGAAAGGEEAAAEEEVEEEEEEEVDVGGGNLFGDDDGY